jgi:hypothetical protein
VLLCSELEPGTHFARSLVCQAVEANNQVYVLTTSTKGSYSLYQVPQDLFTGGMHTQPSPSSLLRLLFFFLTIASSRNVHVRRRRQMWTKAK